MLDQQLTTGAGISVVLLALPALVDEGATAAPTISLAVAAKRGVRGALAVSIILTRKAKVLPGNP